MDKWHALADEKIREAQERGEFDNLTNRGRPLDLRRNPYEPADLRLAHMMLEGAGLTPAWVQERRELDDAVDAARVRLARAWRQFGSGDDQAASASWQAAAAAFRKEAAELNRRIMTYNLQVPAAAFQRLQLDVNFELRRLPERPS